MPHFTVQIHEEQLDDKTEPALIRSLTEAVASVFGDWARKVAGVELRGVPRSRWGAGGEQGGPNAPVVTLSMREGAFHHPEYENAPARLIAAITDAVVEVYGESVREHVVVALSGVPAGRSGVGGEVA